MWGTDRPYVQNPACVVTELPGGGACLTIASEGLQLTVGPSLMKVFQAHKGPLCDKSARSLGIDLLLRDQLLLHRALLPAKGAEILSRGLTSGARDADVDLRIDIADISDGHVVIGSAVDFAQVGKISCYAGPQFIRNHLARLGGSSAKDIGNLAWYPSEGLLDYGTRLAHAVHLADIANSRPIVLGGDHSLTYFAVGALCTARKVGVVVFDAHHDLGNQEVLADIDYLTHANVAAAIRTLPVGFLVQVGLRNSQLRTVTVNEPPVLQISDAQISQLPDLLGDLVAIYPVDGIYLSLDLDCLNPDEAPEVTTPLEGTLSIADFLRAVSSVCDVAPIVGMDVVEVAGSDAPGSAAHAAASAISIVMKAAKSHASAG